MNSRGLDRTRRRGADHLGEEREKRQASEEEAPAAQSLSCVVSIIIALNGDRY